MAHAVVLEHWNWALATVLCFAAITLARLFFNLDGARPPGWARAGIATLGVAGALLLFYTGAQGGRLVFQHGVDVSPSAQR